MTATRLDITIEQGTDYDGFFQLDFDPTGYSAAMQIRLHSIYFTSILTLTTLGGGLVIDGPNMRVYPAIPAAATAAINAGLSYLYDLKLASPAGRTIRAFQGAVYVSEGVTQVAVFAPSVMLLEGGGLLLLENGSPLLLENGNGPDGPIYLLMENGSPLLLENGMPFLLDDGNANPTGPAFLLENGGYLMTENGNYLLMES